MVDPKVDPQPPLTDEAVVALKGRAAGVMDICVTAIQKDLGIAYSAEAMGVYAGIIVRLCDELLAARLEARRHGLHAVEIDGPVQ
jgi:hypothetical protein